MKKIIILFLALSTLGTYIQASSQTHAITFDDFIRIKRISDPQLSPDGDYIVFVVTAMDKERNTSNSDIWIASSKGGEPWRLTSSPKSDFNPRWSPDGKKIAFLSTRGGSPQIWMIDPRGGEASQVTKISTGTRGIIWSPTGKHLAFVSSVYPDCKDDDCNKKRNEKKDKSLVKAKIFNQLLFRHWNSWRDGKRQHIFVIPVEGGKAFDVTPGDYDAPPIDLGSRHDYAFSPDGSQICFVRNTDPELKISLGTNNDLFLSSISGEKTEKITTNRANDNSPHFSPDGRFIAYRAMARPGFEADKYSLMLFDRKSKQIINLTKDFDRSIGTIAWSPDSNHVYFSCQEKESRPIYRISFKKKKVEQAIDRMSIRSGQVMLVDIVKESKIEKVIDKVTAGGFILTPDGKKIIFEKEAINQPREIFHYNLKEKNITQLTDINKKILEALEMNPAEEFWFEGAEGKKVHGLLVKPPFFQPSKKYPLIMLIHGGPQSAWSDNFHYRWNAQMFASPGYVVAMINFHGSTGYGQDFTDSISGDWGGKPFEDIICGLDYLFFHYDFIDKNCLAAAGASYGGYMINWLEGHTERFSCLISHAGVFDFRSMYGATEELWFPEWDLGGTPWANEEMYKKWSPSFYVQNFKTPCLVVHGQYDFRVPVTQGFQLFTSLQRKGVPSKMLYFPDEGHFVVKPQNAELWWKTIHCWLAKYLKEAKQPN